MKPLILTYTGKEIDPLAIRPEDICLEDIAHALSFCNRFAGHTRYPLNVAQHSVYVSCLCDPEDALQGLLHDASEAYLGDITKWVKAQPQYAPYREAEDALQRAIYQKFGCDPEMAPSVAAADKLMLRLEGAEGFGEARWTKWLQNYVHYTLVTPEERTRIDGCMQRPWEPWSRHVSESVFYTRAIALVERRVRWPSTRA